MLVFIVQLKRCLVCFTIVYLCSILLIVMLILCLGSTWFCLWFVVFSVNLNSSHRKHSHCNLNVMSNRFISVKYFLLFVQKRLWFVFDLDFCNNFCHTYCLSELIWHFIKTEGNINYALLPFMLVRSKNLMTQFLVAGWFLVGRTTKNKPQQTP